MEYLITILFPALLFVLSGIKRSSNYDLERDKGDLIRVYAWVIAFFIALIILNDLKII